MVFVAAAICMSCAEPTSDPEPVETPEDAEDEQFVASGKSDTKGVEDYGYEAQCVINLANTATRDELDDDVGLFGKSATDMVEKRPFADLKGVDGVRFVGFLSFNRMLKYAKKNDYCPGLAEEYPPPGELQAADDVLAFITNELHERYPEDNRPMRRDAHPKGHGCVKAFVTIDNEELPRELRQGIFADHGREYPAWIRFSNADITLKHDGEGDARGMAIKLMGVEGPKLLGEHTSPTQDFVLINHDTFFVRHALDYLDFTSAAIDGSPLTFLREFVLSLDPTEIKFRELLIVLEVTKIQISNPLYTRYFSMVPYALGSSDAVKYGATPCEMVEEQIPEDPEDFLRHQLADRLGERDACFTFGVQRQLDPEKMPLEDPTITWEESVSPFMTAAHIRIPQQTFDTPEQMEWCENQSFDPWHSLREHRPLGGINRVRKVVYQSISKLRHDVNGVIRTQPSGHDGQF